MTVVYRRHARVPGVESLTGTNDSTVWRVYHDHIEVVTMLHGRTEARYRNRDFEVTGGTINMLEPGNYHQTVRQHGTATYAVLLLDPRDVRDWLPDLRGELHLRPRVYGVPPHVLEANMRVHALIAQGAEPLAVQEAIAQCLASALALGAEQPGSIASSRPAGLGEQAVQRVVEYLRAQRDLRDEGAYDLAHLAALVECDRFRLIRAFKETLGVTPYQYVIRMRIARARELLRHGSSIAEAAAQAGFADQSHLHRHFKRALGVTPGTYAGAARMRAPAPRTLC